jgi:glutamate-1-semialdehyde aminotransferase
MSNRKDALLQELRNRTPKSGKYWEQPKDLVPGGLISGARKMEPYPRYAKRGKGAYI